MLKFKKALCFLCAGALCTGIIPYSAVSMTAEELRTVSEVLAKASEDAAVPIVQTGELLTGLEHMDVNGDTVIDDSDLALVTPYAAGLSIDEYTNSQKKAGT